MPSANPYDTLIADPREAALEPPRNPYDDIIVDPAQKVRANVTLAAGANPEAIAGQRRLAQYLGFKPAVGEAIPEEVKQMAAVKRVSDDTAGSPTLQRAYSDADFARIGHDDSSVLSDIGKWFESNIGRATAWAMGATPTGGFIGTAKAMPAYTEQTLAGKALAATELLSWASSEAPLYTNAAEYWRQKGRAAAARVEEIDPSQSTIAGGGLQSGMRSFMQQAPYMPLAMAGPLGAGLALAMMATDSGAQSYLKADEKGLSLFKKIAYATTDTAWEAITEAAPLFNLIHNVKVGTPLMASIVKNAWQENKGEQIATITQDFNEWMYLNPQKTLADYIKDRPAAAAQTLIATLVGAGANVTLAHTVQAAADRITGGSRDVAFAQYQSQQLQALLAKAAESKVRTRDAGTFQNLVQQMAQDNPDAPQAVFIDARTLAETLQTTGIDEGVFNQLMPTVAPQLEQALATGGTIELPIGELAAHVAGTPLEQALLPHLRIGSEEALSQVEAEQAEKEQAKLIEQHTERIISESQRGEEVRSQADQIHSDYTQQLQSAGLTPENAAISATLLKAFYVSRAALTGQTPEEVRKAHDIKVQGWVEPAKPGKAAEQVAAEAQKAEQDMVAVRKRESVLNSLLECIG